MGFCKKLAYALETNSRLTPEEKEYVKFLQNKKQPKESQQLNLFGEEKEL